MIPALTAAAVVAWLWFLAFGRARGAVKRLMLRGTLLALIGALVGLAKQRGLFVTSTVAFQLVMLLAVLTVVVAYLYLIRFCRNCGRMVRNLKTAQCPRCSAPLPRHGMAA